MLDYVTKYLAYFESQEVILLHNVCVCEVIIYICTCTTFLKLYYLSLSLSSSLSILLKGRDLKVS